MTRSRRRRIVPIAGLEPDEDPLARREAAEFRAAVGPRTGPARASWRVAGAGRSARPARRLEPDRRPPTRVEAQIAAQEAREFERALDDPPPPPARGRPPAPPTPDRPRARPTPPRATATAPARPPTRVEAQIAAQEARESERALDDPPPPPARGRPQAPPTPDRPRLGRPSSAGSDRLAPPRPPQPASPPTRAGTANVTSTGPSGWRDAYPPHPAELAETADPTLRARFPDHAAEVIDLHGLSQAQALDRLGHVLLELRTSRRRYLRIITGVGRGPTGSVLKPAILRWLVTCADASVARWAPDGETLDVAGALLCELRLGAR